METDGGLGFRDIIPPVMEYEVEKKIQNETETGVIKGLYTDPNEMETGVYRGNSLP